MHASASAEALRQPAARVLAEAQAFLGERITTNPALREQHSHGEDHIPPALPDAVAFIRTTEEAARLLALCNAQHVPVVAWGGGTSSEGQVTPVRGGISLDLSGMVQVLEVNPGDMDCRVQAGVTRQALDAHLRDQGLFFPVDPGGEATIGGMCATRASGTNAVRYGTIRDNVLGLTVALADGRVIRTGGRVRKSATGYDLTGLFIGSEGTLGIITEIQLRLHGIPETMAAAVCQFEHLQEAVEAVIDIMQLGIDVARIELLDDVQMGACIARSKLTEFVPAPTLFFEFHGSASGVAEQAQLATEIAAAHKGQGIQWTADAAGRTRLWRARHEAYWAAKALRPGYVPIAIDVIVPISRLADMIVGAQQDIAASGLTAPIIGHVGDGNMHALILVPPDDPAMARAAAVLDRKIARRALALGGSCSGEHGVGVAKRDLLEEEHGPEALGVMRQLKAALDPHGILNPGKIFLD